MSAPRHSAVLFDLDGTLVDSLADIAASMNHVLAELGHPVHSVDAIRGFVGEGARHLVAQSMPAAASETEIDEALARYKARYRTHLVVDTRPYEGIVALLGRLRLRGVSLGVVTNKPHPAAEQLVHQLFAPGAFGVVIGERVGRKRKPDPEPALDAARALGVHPTHCAFVGDTSVDILTAHAAGMTSVGVTWGFRDRAELEAAGAQHVAAQVSELATLLA